MDKSSSQISQEIADKENEINLASKDRDTVKLEINSLRRKIHETQIEIKKLEDAQIRAEANVRELKTQHSILRDSFWQTKNSGL